MNKIPFVVLLMIALSAAIQPSHADPNRARQVAKQLCEHVRIVDFNNLAKSGCWMKVEGDFGGTPREFDRLDYTGHNDFDWFKVCHAGDLLDMEYTDTPQMRNTNSPMAYVMFVRKSDPVPGATARE